MKYVLGFSGGIDSTFIAWYLKQQGHTVHLVNIKNTKTKNKCCQLPTDLQNIANKLDMKLTIIDGVDKFNNCVINSFLDKYSRGTTPNPCIVCNKLVRFDLLEKFRQKNNFDKIATGHYSDTVKINNENYLAISKDKFKDQTYMLSQISPKISNGTRLLNNIEFPIHKYTKKQVMQMIEKHNIPILTKQESQNICFIPDDNHAKYIQNNSSKRFPSGNIYNTKGEKIGKHKGLIHYTIGQRKGLNIEQSNKRLYVTKIDTQNNALIVGENKDLLSKSLKIKNYFLHENLIKEKPLRGKIRYQNNLEKIKNIEKKENSLIIHFNNKQRAVTPGQYCVIYTDYKDKKILVGGGQIV